MPQDFSQIEWDEALEADARWLIRQAIAEDLDCGHDWTTVALIDAEQRGEAALVARQAGVAAGLKLGTLLISESAADLAWQARRQDGEAVAAGDELAIVSGSVRSLLTLERTLLNFTGRMCGVASLTRRYAEQVTGTSARIYDTRKTTPGWRRLEKYAVRCGGGRNHRLGLYDHVLIKDNHLAFLAERGGGTAGDTAARASDLVREFLSQHLGPERAAGMIVEIEVDSLEQLRQALTRNPEIVLLDNMPPETLRRAVALRDEQSPRTQLEASGGVGLETIREIAATGVDRISVGGLTHSAVWLDVALDWRGGII